MDVTNVFEIEFFRTDLQLFYITNISFAKSVLFVFHPPPPPPIKKRRNNKQTKKFNIIIHIKQKQINEPKTKQKHKPKKAKQNKTIQTKRNKILLL